jgi:hypothetical protein
MTPRSSARAAIEEETYWKLVSILPQIKRKEKRRKLAREVR